MNLNNTFLILMAIAMLATLGALFIGLFSFVKGGAFNKKHGNKLMRIRVYMQGLALVFFAIAIFNQAGG